MGLIQLLVLEPEPAALVLLLELEPVLLQVELVEGEEERKWIEQQGQRCVKLALLKLRPLCFVRMEIAKNALV